MVRLVGPVAVYASGINSAIGHVRSPFFLSFRIRVWNLAEPSLTTPTMQRVRSRT